MNKMYQNTNRWDEALQVADKKDRIHLRNTYDAYGRYLEEKNEVQEAIKMYELANTHRKHIPRLLLHSPAALEKYVQKSKDPCVHILFQVLLRARQIHMIIYICNT